MVQAAWEVRKRNFASLIHFAYPSETIPISVTGNQCALRCAHCGGKYLEGMVSIDSYLAQREIGEGKSLLISGGCDARGRVPFADHAEVLKEITRGKRSVFHVGLVTPEEVSLLRDLATVVSFDLVADEGIIRNVFRLEGTGVRDYWDSYSLLRKEGVNVIPHICLGLPGGNSASEERAIGYLSEMGIDALVLIVFTPTPGTALAASQPPLLEEIVRTMAKARLMLPNVSIFLGCMRPRGKYRALLDQCAVACGLNAIVNPTLPAVELASWLGLDVAETRECCVL